MQGRILFKFAYDFAASVWLTTANMAICPFEEQVTAIEAKVNDVILSNLPVFIEFMDREQAATIVDLSKLPENASETLRIVRIGDYDACACIGAHVSNTSEIGTFRILSHDFNDGVWRLRWKIVRDEN